MPHVLAGRAAVAQLSVQKKGLFGEAQLMIEKLSGSYTGTPMDDRSRPKAERWMKGSFNYRLTKDGGEVLLNRVPEDGKPTQALSSELFYEFSAFGKVLTAAVYKADLSSASVHYLKTDDGLEFDASGFELCLRKIEMGGPPGPWGYAMVEHFDANLGYEFRFKPRCGKVTDKSGRSYAGLFDSNGRPESN